MAGELLDDRPHEGGGDDLELAGLVGATVFHTSFGEGIVNVPRRRGASARAQVHFGRHGSQRLVLPVAKPTPGQ